MACNASQVLADGKGFFGLQTPSLKAVQLQLTADALLAYSPGTDVTFGAIMGRAAANNFTGLTRTQLRMAIMQLACDIKDAL